MSLKDDLQKNAEAWDNEKKKAPAKGQAIVEAYLPRIVDALVSNAGYLMENSVNHGSFTYENGRRFVWTNLSDHQFRYRLDDRTYYSLSESRPHIMNAYPEVHINYVTEAGYMIWIDPVAPYKMEVRRGLLGRQVKIEFTPWGKVLLDAIEKRCKQEGIEFTYHSSISPNHTPSGYKHPSFKYTRFGEFVSLPSYMRGIETSELRTSFCAEFRCYV